MTLICKADQHGVVTLDVLDRKPSGLLIRERHRVFRSHLGSIRRTDWGDDLPLIECAGSIRGFGEFDQESVHWQLGNWIISSDQAVVLGANIKSEKEASNAMRSELQKLRDDAERHCRLAVENNDRDTADAWERIGLALEACNQAIKHDIRLIEQRTGLMAFRAQF